MSERIAPRIDFRAALENAFRLDGKVVFVPGGYGGIGEAIAWGASLAGATVVIAGRDGSKAVELSSALIRAGLKAEGLVLDVTSVEAIRTVVDEILARHGTV